jgi:hypothetical protein
MTKAYRLVVRAEQPDMIEFKGLWFDHMMKEWKPFQYIPKLRNGWFVFNGYRIMEHNIEIDIDEHTLTGAGTNRFGAFRLDGQYHPDTKHWVIQKRYLAAVLKRKKGRPRQHMVVRRVNSGSKGIITFKPTWEMLQQNKRYCQFLRTAFNDRYFDVERKISNGYFSSSEEIREFLVALPDPPTEDELHTFKWMIYFDEHLPDLTYDDYCNETDIKSMEAKIQQDQDERQTLREEVVRIQKEIDEQLIPTVKVIVSTSKLATFDSISRRSRLKSLFERKHYPLEAIRDCLDAQFPEMAKALGIDCDSVSGVDGLSDQMVRAIETHLRTTYTRVTSS